MQPSTLLAFVASRPSRVRATALLIAVVLVAAAAACKADPPGPSGGTLDGSYRLDAVNGNHLPYAYHCFQTVCETLHAGTIEIMSRGRLRDIQQFRRSPSSSMETDTVISTYSVAGGRVIVQRDPLDGAISAYSDSGDLDPNGRILFRPHLIQTYGNSATMLYVKE